MVAHRGRNWQLAPSLIALEAEVDRMAPGRSKRSDGSIGDASHKARQTSDHNPDGGFVDAIDITHDPRGGIDIHAMVRDLARRDDPRVKYIISNGQIHNRSRDKPGKWRRYSGSNAHRAHAHISILNSGRHDTSPWFTASPAAPAPQPAPAAQPSEVPDMGFLAIDGVGLFAVIDGVPVGFPDLAAYGKAKDASTALTMVLAREPGEQLLQELLKKHAAALS